MKTVIRKAACAARLLLLCGFANLLLTDAGLAQQSSPAPVVTYPESVQVSSPLASAPPASAAPTTGQMPLEIPLHALPHGNTVPGGEHASDRAAQTNAAHVLKVQPQANFGGISQDGLIPPDPNIAVGLDRIVEVVNSEIAIYDKNGATLMSPKSLSWLWQNLPGACSQSNSGDPVVQFDRLADNGNGRWIVSQLASLSSPYAECIAVSQGPDPAGSYFVYSYPFGSNLNDYPKFGIWPTASNSAYLATYNLFANGATFVGADLCAYDREAMLAGAASPAQVCWMTPTTAGGFLPSDLDGKTPPLPDEPGYFLAFNASTLNSLTLYKVSLNFASSSTLIGPIEIPVGTFSPACGGNTCIPQPSTKRKLDSLGDRLMYRLAYRNFSTSTTTSESMVVNHSVTSPQGTVGPRWYLLEATTEGQFGVAQQGTYAPNSAYRWMGSIAMDQAGDILLGYSRSSSTSYPSIYVAGRMPSDTPNTLSAETSLLNGGGSQTMYTRWGDYTSMRIDPADDCTFWYVNQYLPQTSFGNWYTYIGSHKFDSCGASTGGGGTGPAQFGLTALPASLGVTHASQNTATITASDVSGTTSSTVSLTLDTSLLPRWTSATLSSNSVDSNGGSVMLTVTANRKAQAGASGSVTVTGNDGNTASVTVPVTVQ